MRGLLPSGPGEQGFRHSFPVVRLILRPEIAAACRSCRSLCIVRLFFSCNDRHRPAGRRQNRDKVRAATVVFRQKIRRQRIRRFIAQRFPAGLRASRCAIHPFNLKNAGRMRRQRGHHGNRIASGIPGVFNQKDPFRIRGPRNEKPKCARNRRSNRTSAKCVERTRQRWLPALSIIRPSK